MLAVLRARTPALHLSEDRAIETLAVGGGGVGEPEWSGVGEHRRPGCRGVEIGRHFDDHGLTSLFRDMEDEPAVVASCRSELKRRVDGEARDVTGGGPAAELRVGRVYDHAVITRLRWLDVGQDKEAGSWQTIDVGAVKLPPMVAVVG